MKSLYLIDSSIYVFRNWFGATEHNNNSGQPNQAFIGFSDFVYRLLSERRPSKIVFAFDQSLKQSTRKEVYPEYKANRSPAPTELKNQFQFCRDWIDALGISQVASEYWEADDLIGTLANLHRSDNCSIVFLTADKDLAQLVREGDVWWPYPDKEALDYRGVTKKFKVKPEQIAEQLALAGDKVDNIPGIPQVGMRTASNLLRKYDTIANLRQHLTEVHKMKFRFAGKVQQSLIENQQILDVSTQLTQINCQVEGLDKVTISRGEPDTGRMKALIETHQMGSVRQQQWIDLIAAMTMENDL